MQTCSKCKAELSDDKSFCDECGTPIAKVTETPKAAQEIKTERNQSASDELVLRTWKPWRWLFTENYGSLKISEGNFIWDLYPSWKHPAVKIIFQIFSYGFHVLGYLTHSGFSPINNVNAIAIVSPQWIKWRFSFLIVNSGGFIGLYPIPEEDLEKAKSFRQALRMASNKKQFVDVR